MLDFSTRLIVFVSTNVLFSFNWKGRINIVEADTLNWLRYCFFFLFFFFFDLLCGLFMLIIRYFDQMCVQNDISDYERITVFQQYLSSRLKNPRSTYANLFWGFIYLPAAVYSYLFCFFSFLSLKSSVSFKKCLI